jgi:restriction endonuclease S subunit
VNEADTYRKFVVPLLQAAGWDNDPHSINEQRYELNLNDLRKVPVPLPPEQRRIVADLDALQSQVDAMKRLQTETAAELDALLPAILDRAFKGGL